MATNDFFRVHEAAKIRSGPYAGLAGTVTDQVTEGDTQKRVRVQIQGNREGQPVEKTVWLKRSQVERLTHGA